MMYLDCEFSSFHGELMSLALVAPTATFYEVLPLPKYMHPWVVQHVVPVLNKAPVSPGFFKQALWHFLRKNQAETVIADWPEDFAHLMFRACGENGYMPNIQLKMELIKSGKLESEIPHHALSDALALKKWHESL